MKVTRLLVSTAMIVSSGYAFADSYQMELNAFYTHMDHKFTSIDDTYAVSGTYHFSPVQLDNVPLAEAAYLGKSNNVQLAIFEDAELVMLSGEFYVPNTIFYVGGAVFHFDNGNVSNTDWFGIIGITPIDGLRISTSFNDESYNLNLNAKYVLAIGTRNFLNLEAYYEEDDWSYHTRGIFADYYFDRTFSIGFGFEDFGLKQRTVRTRKFFSNAVSAELSYTDNNFFSTLTAGLNVRF